MAESGNGGHAVLIVGSGGREHALAWKLAQSPRVSRVIVAPGNDGMPPDWERWPFPVLPDVGSRREFYEQLADRAHSEGVSLAVIGPDNPLADGIVDVFVQNGVPAFGPSAAAARIEASKGFAKAIMQAARVPTARFVATNGVAAARAFLEEVAWPPESGNGWVVKADGLALGKGVIVCASREEAFAAVDRLSAADRDVPLVIEECLAGEELSWMAFCDGDRCALLEPARDFKRVGDRDTGPNTGGMGAFSPVPGIPAGFAERVRDEVFLPTLAEMRRRGCPFRGLLYAGLMVDWKSGRYWVLEFNARFGDPETQVLLPRMADDLYGWCEDVARGNLTERPWLVPFRKNAAVVVVAAAEGYPDRVTTDDRIEIGDDPREGRHLFFGGVRRGGDALQTAGGRVLGGVGTADTLELARSRAYQRLESVHFRGMHFRRDIAASRNSFAVLASGRGSNFEAILEAVRTGALDARIVAVVSDRPDARVLETARAAGIPALSIPVEGLDRPGHERRILEALRPFSPHFLVLAGYMRILTPVLIEAFRSPRGYSRIVNIHPSLLPAFPGVDSYARAFAHGAKVTGVTVHLVEEKVDDGPICAQLAFPIADCRDAADVERRGLALEHRLYPETLSWVLPEKFDLEQLDIVRRSRVCPH